MRQHKADPGLAARIKELEPGGYMECKDHSERCRALASSKALHDAGVIQFECISRTESNGKLRLWRIG